MGYGLSGHGLGPIITGRGVATETHARCASCVIGRPVRLVRFLTTGVPSTDHAGLGSLLDGHVVCISDIVAARCGFPLGPNVGMRVDHRGKHGRFGRGLVGVMCRSTCVVIVRGVRNLLSIGASQRGRHATCAVLGRCIRHSNGRRHMRVIRHLSHSASNLVVFTGSRGARHALHSG